MNMKAHAYAVKLLMWLKENPSTLTYVLVLCAKNHLAH